MQNVQSIYIFYKIQFILKFGTSQAKQKEHRKKEIKGSIFIVFVVFVLYYISVKENIYINYWGGKEFMSNFLAFDFGASSGRAILVKIENDYIDLKEIPSCSWVDLYFFVAPKAIILR